MWHQAIFRSIVRLHLILVRIFLPHSSQHLPLTLPHRTIFTGYSHKDGFITRCLSPSLFSPLLLFFAAVSFASLFLTPRTCLTHDADRDVTLTWWTREGGAELDSEKAPPTPEKKTCHLSHATGYSTASVQERPIGNVSENTICLVLIPRLFASSSLPRPSP